MFNDFQIENESRETSPVCCELCVTIFTVILNTGPYCLRHGSVKVWLLEELFCEEGKMYFALLS